MFTYGNIFVLDEEPIEEPDDGADSERSASPTTGRGEEIPADLRFPDAPVRRASGRRSRGLRTLASMYTHYFRNPLASGRSVESMPEPMVAATT